MLEAAPRRRQERSRSTGCWRIIRAGRTTSRNRCARPSARCGSGCACGARRRSCRGSACCVYGLTFTSHFYGARRTRRLCAVQFRNAGARPAVTRISATRCSRRRSPADYDAVVVINLCVPDRVRRAARPAAESRSTACASSASTCRVSACRPMPRRRTCWPARCCATPAGSRSRARWHGRAALADDADGRADRRAVPGRPGRRRRAAGADGPRRRRRSCRRANGAICTARSIARSPPRCIRSTPHRSARFTPPAGPSSAPARSGVEGTAAWLDAIGKAAGVAAEQIDAAKAQALPAIRAALDANPIDARITVSGYEGSELLVARLLIEAGAEVPYVGTACPRTEWSEPDRAWLEARGTHVQYRASLEQDVAAMQDVRPDLAVGTTPLVQQAKELGIPAIYFTNMVSARPLFGAAGVGALAAIVAAQTQGRANVSPAWSASSTRSAPATPPAMAGTACRRIRRVASERYRKRAREAKAKATAGRGDLTRCSCSITIGRAAIGARSTPSPRSAACGSSSTVRSAARTCRSPRCCITPTRCRRMNCRSSSPACPKTSLSRTAPRRDAARRRRRRTRTCRRWWSPAASPK